MPKGIVIARNDDTVSVAQGSYVTWNLWASEFIRGEWDRAIVGAEVQWTFNDNMDRVGARVIADAPSSSSSAMDDIDDVDLSTATHSCSSSTPVPFTVSCWNVANLGGGFGWPATRDDDVIQAIAQILLDAQADVHVILEVLDRSRACPSRSRVSRLTLANFRLSSSRSRTLTPDQFMVRIVNALALIFNGRSFDWTSDSRPSHEILPHLWTICADQVLAEFGSSIGDLDDDASAAFAARLETVSMAVVACARKGLSKIDAAVMTKDGTTLLKALADDFLAGCGTSSATSSSSSASGKGVQQLQAIASAMGSEWALYVPLDASSGGVKYTENETYGFICRKSKVAVASFEWCPSGFSGRAPVIAWCAVQGLDAEVGVIAYHPPSDSATNAGKRTASFPALATLCTNLRARDRIIVLAFDSNIDTRFGNDAIDNFNGSLTVSGLFESISGDSNWLTTTLFRDAATSLRKTKIGHELSGILKETALSSMPDSVLHTIEDYVRGAGHKYLFNAFDKLVVVNKACGSLTALLDGEFVHPLLLEKQWTGADLDRLTQARRLSDHVLVLIRLLIGSQPHASGFGLWDDVGVIETDGGYGDMTPETTHDNGVVRVSCLAQRFPSCGQRAAYNAIAMRTSADSDELAGALGYDDALRAMGGLEWNISNDRVRDILDSAPGGNGADIPVVVDLARVEELLGIDDPSEMEETEILLQQFMVGDGPGTIQIVLHTGAGSARAASATSTSSLSSSSSPAASSSASTSPSIVIGGHFIAVELTRTSAGTIRARYADSLPNDVDRSALVADLVRACGLQLA